MVYHLIYQTFTLFCQCCFLVGLVMSLILINCRMCCQVSCLVSTCQLLWRCFSIYSCYSSRCSIERIMFFCHTFFPSFLTVVLQSCAYQEGWISKIICDRCQSIEELNVKSTYGIAVNSLHPLLNSHNVFPIFSVPPKMTIAIIRCIKVEISVNLLSVFACRLNCFLITSQPTVLLACVPSTACTYYSGKNQPWTKNCYVEDLGKVS